MTIIQSEQFAAVYDDALPLLSRHWNEVAHYRDIPLDVAVAKYQAADAAGFFRLYTARKDGKLIGYLSFFLGANWHYAGSLQATQDVFYVSPDHRGAMVGMRLLRHAHRALNSDGVQVVAQHQKLAHPALGRLLAHEGYTPVETIWSKRLDTDVAINPPVNHVMRQAVAGALPAPQAELEGRN